jgi:hypothetical protein
LPGHHSEWVTITDRDVVAASGSDQHAIVRPSPQPTDAVTGPVFTITATELAGADTREIDDYRRPPLTLGLGRDAWVYLAAR